MGAVRDVVAGRPKATAAPKRKRREPKPVAQRAELRSRDENTSRAVLARSSRTNLISGRGGGGATRSGINVPR